MLLIVLTSNSFANSHNASSSLISLISSVFAIAIDITSTSETIRCFSFASNFRYFANSSISSLLFLVIFIVFSLFFTYFGSSNQLNLSWSLEPTEYSNSNFFDINISFLLFPFLF